MKRFTALLLLLPQILFSQDLTGVWEGEGNWTGAAYIKLVLVKCGDEYVGYSYDRGPGFCKANFAGDYNEETRRLKGENKGMIRKTFEHIQSRFDMTYKKEAAAEFLVGQIRAKSAFATIMTFGITETIRLRRTSTTVDDTTDFMRPCMKVQEKPKQEIVKPKQLPVEKLPDTAISLPPPVQRVPIALIKDERKNDTVATISTAAQEIYISVYDNGQIDGDTITIFHNNQIVADRLCVNATPYKFSIAIDRNKPLHDIVFVANNLGSIPPNTAVLIIECGDKKYNLFASSDLKRNSVVIFKFTSD